MTKFYSQNNGLIVVFGSFWYVLAVKLSEILKKSFGLFKRNTKVVFADLVIGYFAFFLGLFVRADFRINKRLVMDLLFEPVLFLLFILIFGLILGVYRGKYKVGTLDEVLALNTQGFLSSLSVLFLREVFDLGLYPRSVPLISALLFVILALSIRLMFRLKIQSNFTKLSSGNNILIYGAGTLGLQIANLVHHDTKLNLVGYVDDDPYKSKLIINGVRVVSNLKNLDNYLSDHHVNQLIIAFSQMNPAKLKKINEICGKRKVNIRAINSASQLILGVGSLSELISLNESSILGREPISIDKVAIQELMHGKKILITGAGGSIGSEIAKQCVQYAPGEVFLLDRDESALHALELEIYGTGFMSSKYLMLADIRDVDALNEIFENCRPDMVFHAAALKHLPVLENFPEEAYKTNVIGTKNVVSACLKNQVKTLINISTDKAADPTSVLGKSKFEAELITASAAIEARKTLPESKYLSVRFGNVIGSRGSVLHTFKYQIDHNLPVTITDPEVTRYFMTVQEAVNLVLQSTVEGDTGETLILDMGKPVKIHEIAKFLIAQSGKDVPIIFTGLRPGEKLQEVLSSSTEKLKNHSHPKIFHTKVLQES